MRVLDTIFALFAVLSFIGFLGILAWHVPAPALLVVIAVVVLMALHDFARSFFLGQGGTH